MASYSVEVRHHAGADDHTVLHVEGEIDLTVGSELLQTIVCAAAVGGATEVTVDLSGVTFLDSSGISALVQAHHRLAEANAAMVVVGGPQSVQRVLAITGVDRLLGPETADPQQPHVASA
jgi:anti-sigma B factor antagonist